MILCRQFLMRYVSVYTDVISSFCLQVGVLINYYFVHTGVQKIMVPGTSVKSSKEALRLSRLYPGIIYSTAGKFTF